MLRKVHWSFDPKARLNRASYGCNHELLVGDRHDGCYDSFVVHTETNDTVWNSDKSYASLAAAKRGAIAAAKRLLHETGEPTPAPVQPAQAAPVEKVVAAAETIREAPSPLWESRDGYHMATIRQGQQAARCSIVQIDPDHVLGFIRLGGMTLRIEYGGLMEAKQAIWKRASGLLEQLLPEGMFAGGL